MIRTILLAGTVAAAPAAAIAAETPLAVTTRMLVERRVAAADGSTAVTRAAPTRAVPGDRVIVLVDYRNAGPAPINDLMIANPVPQGIAYRAPDRGSPPPELSVDGVRFGPLSTLRVGARPATADDVRQVRWRLGRSLPPGGAGQFAFHAVLR